jgi:glycosyltransferase involved in cell wall biosynthesis
MTQLTILHTIETAGPGGAENVLLSLASNLDPGRYRSLALLPDGRWLPGKLREKGIPTVTAESKGWHDLSLLRTMARIVREEKVSLIHSHLPDQNFYSCLVGGYTKCKTVVTYHGSPGEPRNFKSKQAFKAWVVRRTADAVVVVSDYLKGLFGELGFPAHKITRIYNGVDLQRFASSQAGQLRAETHSSLDTKLVGMVANLRQSKGYEHLIRAARIVIDAQPQTRFIAVGETNHRTAGAMTALIGELGLQDRFLFLGFREDVPAVLNDLDVFVLSSTVEGLSIATIEAMAAGKPVVATRSGGPQEIVDEGRTGFLVPPANSEAMAARICELLAHPDMAAVMGRNARKAVEGKFSLSGMVNQYENLYERCLAGT